MHKNILIKEGNKFSILSVHSHSHRLIVTSDNYENIEVPIKTQLFHIIEENKDHLDEVNRILRDGDYLIFNDIIEFQKWYEDWKPIEVIDSEKEILLERLGWIRKDDMWEIPKYFQSKKGDKCLTLDLAWNFLSHL